MPVPEKVEYTMAPPYPYSYSSNVTFRVIGQGPGDNFHVHQIVTFTWDGTTFNVDVKKNEVECRG